MIEKANKVLVLAPHTDDGELGCGATINKFVEEGKTVYYASFSLCVNSLAEGLPSNTLEIEVKAATKSLGIPEENLRIFDFEVRKFDSCRQEILEELVTLSKEINPDIVFIPSQHDIHQDHQVISNEGLRAFKRKTILGYEMPWNNLKFETSCFSKIDETHLNAKIEALQQYKSQAHRDYIGGDFIKSLATTRGVQIGSKYAEAFEIIRCVF